MVIIEQLEPNKHLPIHEEYEDLVQARKFWWDSYELKRNYLWSKDANGGDIIMRHRCEDSDDYQKRLQSTKPRAYLQQIINQFNSFVFNTDIVRSGVPEEFIEDADGDGTSLNELMREATIKAQVKGGHVLMPDFTGPQEEISQAQAAALGVRPIIRSYDIDSVINWNDEEVIIRFSETFARYYNDEVYIDLVISKNNRNSIVIKDISAPVSHGYDKKPIVILRPKLWVESQAAKLADITQTIFNLQSLLTSELYNKTFTHVVLAGDFEADEIENIQFGSGQATILTTQGGTAPSIQTIGGAVVAQADSIRTSLIDERNALYETAALQRVTSKDAIDTEAALSKQLDSQATFAVVQAIADSDEEAENKLWNLFGIDAESDYSAAYKEPEVEETPEPMEAMEIPEEEPEDEVEG